MFSPLENWLAARYLHIQTVIRKKKVYIAVTHTLGSLLPFVIIGSMLQAVSRSIFMQNGFFYSIYHIGEWLPAARSIGQVMNALSDITINFSLFLGAFLFAKYLARLYNLNDGIVGWVAMLAAMILQVNLLAGVSRINIGSSLTNNGGGVHNIFVGLLVGLAATQAYRGCAWIASHWQHAPATWQEETFVTRGLHAVFPVSVVLAVAVGLSLLISLTGQNGFAGLLLYSIALPRWAFSHAIVTIMLITLWNNVLNVVGLSGPLSPFSQLTVDSTQSSKNLTVALKTGSLNNLPYRVTFHTVYDVYGAMGGNGMTLALVVAIILLSRQPDRRKVGWWTLFPTLMNFNDIALVGFPILFNPIYIVPYLLAPLVSMTVGWIPLHFGWVPPVVYNTFNTGPGFLTAFLGTNGNWAALLTSVLAFLAGLLVYVPFIRIDNLAWLQTLTGELPTQQQEEAKLSGEELIPARPHPAIKKTESY